MKPVAKVAIVSSIVLAVGVVICAGALAIGGTKILRSNVEYVSRTVDIDDEFNNINIDVTTDDIYFCLSDDDSCRIELLEPEGTDHEINVQSDTLMISSEDEDGFHLMIGINNDSPHIKIYLPLSVYDSIGITNTTGDIYFDDGFTFDSVLINVLTGDVFMSSSDVTGDIEINGGTTDINLEDVTCSNLLYNGTTGDVILNNVIASGDYRIELTTGDVSFDGCDAQNIFTSTTTGDIEGSILTDKVFDAHAVTGDVDVPRSSDEGGICELSANTGDIFIVIAD